MISFYGVMERTWTEAEQGWGAAWDSDASTAPSLTCKMGSRQAVLPTQIMGPSYLADCQVLKRFVLFLEYLL